jgi:hypothetical protein
MAALTECLDAAVHGHPAARALADNAAMPPDTSVAFRSVDVYEVVRDVGRT